MQKYRKIKKLEPPEFKRLTGVHPETFQKMIQRLKAAKAQKMSKGGKPHRLTLEDQLLRALEYLREYRTYFHLGQSYGLSESACYRSCRWIEDSLIKSGTFSLPGKKALLKSDTEYEVILIDAAESPIERPKKKRSKIGIIDKSTFILGKRKDTP
jgi:Helix-turn-helix of DDE superfamily endonuclease